MSKYVENSAKWPIWGHLRVADRQLWACDEWPLSASGEWQGRTRNLADEPALALELARVNRARRSASDPTLPVERARALLGFAGEAGPLGQQRRPRHQPGSWYPLEQISWALAHAAALDFMLTLGGAFFCGEHAIVDRQLLGIAEADESLITVAGRQLSKLVVSERMRSGSPEHRLWALSDAILSPNMQARRVIEDGHVVLHFDSLFGVAHSQLALWLEKGNFGRCETCLSFFPRTDKRQLYCPPAWREQSESRCGSRGRMRKRRGSTERFIVPDDGQNLFLLTQDNDVPAEFAVYSEPTPS